MWTTRVIVGVTWYVALNCDEVYKLNNQSWLFVHYYVVENWVKFLILISLDRMVEGSRSNNLIKVIMEAMMIGGGLARDHIANKVVSFGVDGVNVFQGTKIGVIKQIHDQYAYHSIGVHCMAHHTNLVM
jgi:hypothetical protein